MRQLRKGSLLILAIAVAMNPVWAAPKAEKAAKPHKETLTLSGKRAAADISRSVITVGDVPDHEIAQRVYSYAIASPKAKDFNGATTMNFAHVDSIAGAGTHHGYATWHLKNGDAVYLKFDGHHEGPAVDGHAAGYSGEFEFTGGTGKYARIKGKAKYTGKTDASGGSWETSVDVEY